MEEQITIIANDQLLRGVLHIPQINKNSKVPVVIICHGFIGSKVGQHRIFVKTARELCAAGLAVLRFDYSGCGESSGEYRDITLPQLIEQTIKVIDFAIVHPNIHADQIVLLGHSLGGCVAATVAGLDTRVSKLILWSPVARPFEDIVGIIGEQLYSECLQNRVVNYQGFEIGIGFLASLSQIRPLEKVQDFQGKVLLVHGSEDAETPLENAYMYWRVLGKKSQVSQELQVIEEADHTYNSPIWEKKVIGVTLNWLDSGLRKVI